MVVIIEEGKVPEKKPPATYKATCENCGTVFEYGYSDLRISEGGGFLINCPLRKCKNVVFHNESR